jgi:hypothetical protein
VSPSRFSVSASAGRSARVQRVHPREDLLFARATPPTLDQAHTFLAASAERFSTPEERATATDRNQLRVGLNLLSLEVSRDCSLEDKILL